MSEEKSTEPEAQKPDSLLGGSVELGEGEYLLSDGVKGVGEKPDWYLSDKYQSVSDQAKGYAELQKKFGSFTGSPKDGYELPEGVDSEDELAKEFIELATDLNMNQEGFNRGLELYFAQSQASAEIDQEAEIAKLGENPAQRIQALDNALKARLKDEYDEVKGLVTTADTIILAEKIMKAFVPARLPIDGGEHPQGLTWADIEKEMHKKDANGRLLRSTDPSHNAKVERMMKEFGGDKGTPVVVG